MRLENIGFYTLSNKRAASVSWESPLQRCELILTDRCNFKCQYCRGIKSEYKGDLTFSEAKNIVDLWVKRGLKNIRLSGGEPTMWPDLIELVQYIKLKSCIEHIAISTNGSASIDKYDQLIDVGVNDFSISLDACCATTANKMAGINSRFNHISNVIKYLSSKTYCTVGIVLDDRNINEIKDIIEYATLLGVSDIRIIPSAQDNRMLNIDVKTEYPILKYRIGNFKKGRHVRGLQVNDSHKCHLVKDDMIILHNQHFPCVIYMREQGKSIGSVCGKNIEEIMNERKFWFENMDCFNDTICKNNCLDVCIDHNNMVEFLATSEPRMASE